MSESAKTINDLREHLFATIAGVRDGSVSVEQAKTIGDLSQVMVNVAKVEVDYLRTTGQQQSPFLSAPQITGAPAALPNGITGVRRHILKDE